ncbi:MAG TPA: hypothetical protein VHE83_08545 [Mycobacteriales bacterium]|nr:hypothetical protein [Mycobacteriales bacterium]
MRDYCRHCGATENNGGGCRHCDPARRTSRVAKSEVSFGPLGRTVMMILYAAFVAGIFYVAHHNLDEHPLAWWVLVAFAGLMGPVALLGIWKPVRRPRHH